MKSIYLSHPFSSSPIENREKSIKICEEILNTEEEDILIFNPLTAFYAREETPEIRSFIMDICLLLIPYFKNLYKYGNSEGCDLEECFARSMAIKVEIKE